jgi:hypothetical protein
MKTARPKTKNGHPSLQDSRGTKRFRQLRNGQLSLIDGVKSAYGGSLRNTRRGRKGARPLSTRQSMHLVLRSSKAKGAQSFLRPQNAKRIKSVVDKFSFIYGVQILSQANVGNHLHLHLRLGNRYGYKPFIRAITGAIAMAVSGRNRWTTSKSLTKESVSGSEQNVRAERFWDFRPFTRVVEGLRSILRLEDYVRINRLEAFGIERKRARVIVDRGKVAEIAIQ